METISTITLRWYLSTFATLASFIILVFYFNPAQNSSSSLIDYVPDEAPLLQALSLGGNETRQDMNGGDEEEEKLCNIFDGKWVYKPDASPLYTATQCPFLSVNVSCQRNGRPDNEYEKWSWEAKGCKIPRFNGTDMLERLRGKRVILVGDSLNRNQFESLACLLYSSIPSSQAHVDVTNGGYKIFKAKEHNCSVEFFWSPFLLELEVDKSNGTKRVLRLDKLSSSARRWVGADIMVFNSGHWWMHMGKIRAWDVFRYKNKLIENMDIESAFRTAMKTWGKWIDHNVDQTKTTIFVRSLSHQHLGRETCHNKTKPIMVESHVAAFQSPPVDMVQTTQDMINKGSMKTPIMFLNITKMSRYRIDAHPSVYRTKQGNLVLTEKGDCSHWCLPGVPDSWNMLLYASMILNMSENFQVPSHPVARPV